MAGSVRADDGFSTGVVVFSPELEAVIAEVLPTSDVFGSPNFDAVEYINKTFPNEHSLGNLDSLLQKLKGDIRQLDDQILIAVREQSSAGIKAKHDLAEGKVAMQELFQKIKLIREKSEQSEGVVQEIGRDIKSLDCAKRHLVSTITTLKRFHNLASAVEELDGMAAKRQYREAGSRLEGVNGLSQHFENFKRVPRLNDLRDSVDRMKAFLHKQIVGEFNNLGVEALDAQALVLLKDACEVVNALGPQVRQEVISKFCEQQLAPYNAQFARPAENGTLDKTELRYKWLKKQLKVYDEQWAKVFPPSWATSRALCNEFCSTTRRHLIDILDDCKDRVDVQVLIQKLQATISFENELSSKFGLHQRSKSDPNHEEMEEVSHQQNQSKGPAGKDAPTAPAAAPPEIISFRGAISSCFEPYMGPYLELVDRNLSKRVGELLRDEKWTLPDDSAAGTNKVLISSSQLFLCIRSSLKECSAFTRHQTLLSMHKVFKKYLRIYCDALAQKIPKATGGNAGLLSDREEQVKLTERDEHTTCLIINTANYCLDTTGQLADSIKRTIDKAFADAIDVSSELEEYSGVITRGVRILVLGFETRVQQCLDAMTKMPWGAMDAVGDQSPYINAIANVIQNSVPHLGELLSSTHFRFFCDKLVASLIPRFVVSIYRCKRISEYGAQQLQVDTHSLKTILLKIPACTPQGIPSGYQKFVEKEMGKVDTLVKVLLNPPENVADAYWKMVPDGSPADFQKILELKGLRSSGIRLPLGNAMKTTPSTPTSGSAPERSLGPANLSMPNVMRPGMTADTGKAIHNVAKNLWLRVTEKDEKGPAGMIGTALAGQGTGGGSGVGFGSLGPGGRDSGEFGRREGSYPGLATSAAGGGGAGVPGGGSGGALSTAGGSGKLLGDGKAKGALESLFNKTATALKNVGKEGGAAGGGGGGPGGSSGGGVSPVPDEPVMGGGAKFKKLAKSLMNS